MMKLPSPAPEGETMAPPRQASNVALEEVTNAAFNGVLRALEARKLPLEKFPGPILIGIIAWPERRAALSERTAGHGGRGRLRGRRRNPERAVRVVPRPAAARHARGARTRRPG